MTSQHLSKAELYYTPASAIEEDSIKLYDEEFHHCIKVMRNKAGDEIYITDGEGKIYLAIIKETGKSELTAAVKEIYKYDNPLNNIYFCIPKLKSGNRFEFAIEKSTELGITNFIVFESSRSISKKEKTERWEKITLSAMKQSLRSFRPSFKILSLKEILQSSGKKVLLEQNSTKHISELKIDPSTNYYFVFGPEGGLTENEMNMFDKNNIYKLSGNRLRTETAIIKCVSLLGG